MHPSEEIVDLTPFASNTDEWKQRMLADIERSQSRLSDVEARTASVSHFRKPVPKWVPWVAAAALVLTLGGTWWWRTSHSPSAALALLADAYSVQRPFEFRIAGATHQPWDAKRGPAATNSSSLAQSLQLIDEAPEDSSDKALWKRADATAKLLSGDYDGAITAFNEAIGSNNQDAAAYGGLGIALLKKAELDGRPEDTAQALEEFERAIKLSPNDPVLYFNRALALERGFHYNDALKDWDTFLRLENTGGWAEEAQQHKARIQDRLRPQAQNVTSSQAEEAITLLAASGFQPRGGPDPEKVAEELAQHHGDLWLSKFLPLARRTIAQKGVDALANAAKSFSNGDSSRGTTLAEAAVAEYRRLGSTPGVVFAQFQQAYGLQRLSRADECIAVAKAGGQEAERQQYRWLEVQLQLTQAACLALQANGQQARYDEAYNLAKAAEDTASEAHFTNLTLRALGFQSGILREVGAYREAMGIDTATLRKVWSGEGTLSRAYQAYYGLGIAEMNLSLTRAASASLREAVTIASAQRDRAVEGMVRSRLAEALMQSGDFAAAAQEFEKSAQSFGKAPQSPSTEFYRTYSETVRARLDGLQGRSEQGLATIQKMEAMLEKAHNPTLESLAWQAEAELLARSGRLQESEVPLTRILALGAAAREALPSAADRGALTRNVAEAVKVLVDRYLEKGAPEEAWRVWSLYRPSFQSVGSPSAEAVQVSYVDLPAGPVVWIAGKELRYVRLAVSGERIRSLASSFRRATADAKRPVGEVAAMGRSLYAELVLPVASHLKVARHIYIAADDAFAGIPFTALVTPNGAWWGEEVQVVYSPSTGRADFNRPVEAGRDLRLLGFGYGAETQILQRRFPTLPDLDEEVQQAASAFPQRLVLTSGRATPIAVQAALPQSDLIHFSGHVLLTAGDAAFVLAPASSRETSRLLWASQIPVESLRRVRLAMLAGCSTGSYGEENRDASSTMARTFLMRGVPQVIASRWDVSSRATAEFVRHFYDELNRGLGPEEAVSEASRALRRVPQFAHPSYWAAFDLFRG
jgi:CHAT domain-containing protein/Flp pilus assembly protein TadD